MKNKSPILSFVLSLAAATSAVAQLTAFTYEGRLIDGGRPATGTYDLQFSLWDAVALGNQVGGNATVAPVAVSNGLFIVTLDFGPTAFNGSARWLQINVRTNGSLAAYTDLSPRQAITAAPYAIYAATAGTVPDGAVTSAKLAPNAVTAAKLATGAVTSLQLADDLELGSAAANGELTLWNAANDTESIRLLGASHQIRLHGSAGTEQLRLDGNIGGHLLLFDRNNTDQTVTLSSGSTFIPVPAPNGTYVDSGGSLALAYANGAPRASLAGPSLGGELSLFDSDNTETVRILAAESGTTGGAILLKNAAGTATAKLDGDSGAAGWLGLYHHNGSLMCELDALDSTSAGQFSMFNAGGFETVEIKAAQSSTTGGALTLRNAAGVATVGLNGDSATAGWLGLYKSDGQLMVEVDALDSTSAGQFSMFNANGTETVEIKAAESAANPGGQITLKKADGTATITLDADYGGDGRVITQELQITGGSDLSEKFNVTDPADQLKAGMVVRIDPDRPGQLILSGTAYDRTVAGVVSGAGGIKPGMLMGQGGSVADGKHPVALTGRVYCWADASYGAIRPGDLLTTSATPGHAMKVADHARAQGAILGKAMTVLDQGQGLVLVLVTLQ